MNLDAIYTGDALTTLKTFPDQSINCIVTSPPYFNLRDYGVAEQIGGEKTVKAYIDRLAAVFTEAWRVLRDDGTLWVNLADTYSGGGRGDSPDSKSKQASNIGALTGKRTSGELPNKSLMLIPARFAIAMSDMGWIVRSDIIWNKPNPMPESVADRPTKSHEHVFLFAKSQRYFYDQAAINEPAKNWGKRDRSKGKYNNEGTGLQPHTGLEDSQRDNDGRFSRNSRDVWTVPTEANGVDHYATFPTQLIKPMILAGCPIGGVVLDLFMGSGTTALMARQLDRHYVGIELNPEYADLARRRLDSSDPYRDHLLTNGLSQFSMWG